MIDQCLGIDVSAWQGEIDWSLLPEEVVFVYAKATEGRRRAKFFATNWSEAVRWGRIPGGYALLRLDEDSAEQASLLCDTVPWGGGGCTPLALDLETKRIDEAGATRAAAGILSAVDVVERRTGVSPAIYISPRGVRHLRGQLDSTLARCPLWLCDRDGEPDPPPPPWESWWIWQYTSSGPGKAWGMESSGLDVNRCAWSEEELRRWVAALPWRHRTRAERVRDAMARISRWNPEG